MERARERASDVKEKRRERVVRGSLLSPPLVASKMVDYGDRVPSPLCLDSLGGFSLCEPSSALE